jgi:hypothetical protein
MTTATTAVSTQREPELLGLVIGGSAGIGLETARRARAEGASGLCHISGFHLLLLSSRREPGNAIPMP